MYQQGGGVSAYTNQHIATALYWRDIVLFRNVKLPLIVYLVNVIVPGSLNFIKARCVGGVYTSSQVRR